MDFYVILGLDAGASAAEIKRAYRRLSRRYHPGINPGDRAAEAFFRQIAEAYETLSDPQRRQQYDAAGGAARPAVESGAFEFAGFDFSFAAHGTDAATFGELFAEVLHPPAAEPSRPEAGRGSARVAQRHVRGIDARGRAPGRGHAPDRVHGVRGNRTHPHAGRPVRPVPGDRQGAVGPRPHGVFEIVRRRAAAAAGTALSAARSAARTGARSEARR